MPGNEAEMQTHTQSNVLLDAREARDNETKSLSLRYVLSHCTCRVVMKEYCIHCLNVDTVCGSRYEECELVATPFLFGIGT
jgi:hypothetical protein